VRDRADMPSLNRPTNEQLDRLINLKAKRLYAMVALKDPSSYATISASFDASSGSVAFATSLTDYFKLLRVDASVGGEWRRVERFGLKEPASSTGPCGSMRYQLRGTTLYFTPTPPPYSTVRVVYTPRLADLVDGSSLDGINGWEELLALDAAIQLLNDEDSDSSALVRERGWLWDQLATEADNQDQGEAPVVEDVRERDGW
jgi:hypothetical protein